MENYKICRVTRVAYDRVLAAIDDGGGSGNGVSYDEKLENFFRDSAVYTNSFIREMNALGNEGDEIVYNADSLQKTWAAENGVEFGEDHWNREILEAQISALRPDVLYIQGLTTSPDGFLPENGFRERFPFIKLVVAYVGFAHDHDRLEGIDVVVTGPPLDDYFERNGMPAHVVYHGFDDSVLAKLGRNGAGAPAPDEPLFDLTFTGTSGAGHGSTHRERYWALARLVLETGLEAWVDDTRVDGAPAPGEGEQMRRAIADVSRRFPAKYVVEQLRQSFTEAFGSDNPRLSLATLFPEHCNGPVYGVDMYDVLRRSRLSFNRHNNVYDRVFGNMRVFEATGVGSCLVTDTASNARDLFEADTEIVTYASLEECIEKINYLLANEEERRTIAEAGQRRTLGEHTMGHRCAQIHDIISRRLGA